MHSEIKDFKSYYCDVIFVTQQEQENHNTFTHEEFDVQIGGETISNLGLTVDLAIMGESQKKLQLFINMSKECSNMVGLKMNIGKTNSTVGTRHV